MQEPPPPPPDGAIPPPGAVPASPASAPPPPQRSRSVAALVIAGIIFLVVAGVGAAVFAGRDADETPDAASSTSSEPSPSPTSAPTPTIAGPQDLPDEIGGAPRLTGSGGDAIAAMMDGLTDGQIQAAGLYGTLQQPAYIYFVVGTSEGMAGLPLPEFLNLMAAGGGFKVDGKIETRTDGDIEAACGTTDDPAVGFICVTIDEDSVDALMGYEPAPVSRQLDLAIEAAG